MTHRNDNVIRPACLDDLEGVYALIEDASLSTDGIQDHIESMLVAVRDETIIASAALEMYGDCALLRSVAVSTSLRGTGLGKNMTKAILQRARDTGVTRVFLLTETAGEFFPRFGFRPVARDMIPEPVKTSVEFVTVCPETALAMELRLQ